MSLTREISWQFQGRSEVSYERRVAGGWFDVQFFGRADLGFFGCFYPLVPSCCSPDFVAERAAFWTRLERPDVFWIISTGMTEGMNTENTVPEFPGRVLLLARMDPPCFWTIPCDTQSPSPVPLSPLVVKKGSKSLAR
jgi:hypothetical protein